MIEKVHIKCLERNDQVCVNINKSFSLDMREDPKPRQIFYETILPKIIIHEFYHRHIFQYNTIVLNAEYSSHNVYQKTYIVVQD